ncbi:MAG: putative 2-aminoethylphosphonate ABC transporter ATP-binding protein [Hyphomicrobiaceae bacterium]|nr:putative 2-aminoethylphosphonate ABC transporter ATP-binding protein [Hyphomicrobiaceae bacterium]
MASLQSAADAPREFVADATGARPVHVSIVDVSKRFGVFQALRSVNLNIHDGEFICFLGPSGCGKTTLLRAIAGLDPQSEGAIFIGGRDVSRLPPADRDFGIVFQSYALFPNLTVAANVGYGLVNRRMGRKAIDHRVAELLETVGLEDQASKFPVQLSGGQQQRVALARALATSPSLLLLDEPLSALDARVRVRLRDELKSLQRRLGLTTIMVTHDQEEAMGLADRIVVMNRGEIEQVGSPGEVYTRPHSAFVADFIGTMNFFDAEVVGTHQLRLGETALETGDTIGAAKGAKVRVGIRPEELRIGDAGSGTNALSGQVRGISFHGGFCRVTLLLDIEHPLELAADVPAQRLRGMTLAVGQPVAVTMPPEHVHVFG